MVDGDLQHKLAVARRRWRLTERQLAVLERLARGRRSAEIAAELGIVERTVRMHVTGMLLRSRSRTRAELLEKLSAR